MMRTYLSRRTPVVVAAVLALAMLALGFLAALGVRSLVAGTASASPAAPNPGHSYDQIELPAGTWPGLNADLLDGLDSTALALASRQHPSLMKIALLKWYDVSSSASFQVGAGPWGVAFDGGSIWVANSNSDNVTKLRASDGALLGTYDVGDGPFGVAFDGASIWVANAGSNNVTKL